MGTRRSGFNQEVAAALVETGAIDLDKMTDVYRSFAKDALVRGDELVLIISKNILINCGWPVPVLRDQLGGFENAGG